MFYTYFKIKDNQQSKIIVSNFLLESTIWKYTSFFIFSFGWENDFLFLKLTITLIINKNPQKIMHFDQRLKQLLKTLESQQTYYKVLRRAKQLESINVLQLKNINPASFLQFYKMKDLTIGTHSQPKLECQIQQASSLQQIWHPNQFKYFLWLSVCYSFIKNRQIQQFVEDDINFIASIFSKKQPIFIEYNLCSLLHRERNKKENWLQEQIDLLHSIIKQTYPLFKPEHYKGKWSEISYTLYEKSEKKYFRTSHKCREKWFNHLSPFVKHGKWSQEQDLLLFKLIDRYSFKWSSISRQMNGSRTEHMVKNRYNSIYRRYTTRHHLKGTVSSKIQAIIIDLNQKMAQNQSQELQPQIEQKCSNIQKKKEQITEINEINSIHYEQPNKQTPSLQYIQLEKKWQDLQIIKIKHFNLENYDYEEEVKRSYAWQEIDFVSMQFEPIIGQDFNIF